MRIGRVRFRREFFKNADAAAPDLNIQTVGSSHYFGDIHKSVMEKITKPGKLKTKVKLILVNCHYIKKGNAERLPWKTVSRIPQTQCITSQTYIAPGFIT
jgi:hypothetical protein